MERSGVPADMVWLSCLDERLGLRGLAAKPSLPLCRMEPEAAQGVSPGVDEMMRMTSGIRLCFRTDAPRIGLRVRLYQVEDWPCQPKSATSGFDLYMGEGTACRYVRNFSTVGDSLDISVEHVFQRDPGMKTLTIYFPLYNNVRECAVGLPAGAQLEAAPVGGKPVVFYGSSITHGLDASRPGNSYPAILSRMLPAEFLNLGFSGRAMGEPAMAAYIATLPMRAFVLDYDHNAPSAAHLEATHAAFYRTVRQAQPTLPIVMVSKPDVLACDPEDAARRRDIVEATYRRAVEEGDRHMAFVDGGRLFDGLQPDACTVDGTHPNDLGFMRMAQGIAPALQRLLAEGE